MTGAEQQQDTGAERISAAANAHDLDRLADCFTDDYLNETPAHPAQGFRGREQVRRNWRHIFAAVPDLTAEVLRSDQVGDRVWSEWEMRGRRVDGALHLMRGIMLFTVEGARARAVRFYMEPVDHAPVDVNQAVDRLFTSPGP